MKAKRKFSIEIQFLFRTEFSLRTCYKADIYEVSKHYKNVSERMISLPELQGLGIIASKFRKL